MRKLVAFFSILAIVVSMFGTAAFADTANQQENGEEKVLIASGIIPLTSVASYWPGDHDLGGFTFNDYNYGSTRTFYANYMQIKPAWKAADSTTSEVDLYIKVVREWNGYVAYQHRFTLSDDVDGKDGDGWWYAESPWFAINNGSDYYIYYEAFTTPGYTPTGYNRSAHVHTWIELSN